MNDQRVNLNPLPLDEAWKEINASLSTHRNLVLVAEPGAGKTTRFPPALLHSGLVPKEKKILMLEPRRLAARASAARIAEEQGWRLGNEVGYQVRFDNRTTRDTRLHVLTEGLLARRLQSDPELSDVGAVILDEFHERSLHTDLAIGLLFELQQLSRPDLRLIVMSATLDAERVSRFLDDAPVVRVPGRTYPVETAHSKTPLHLDTGPEFLEHVSSTVIDLIEGRKPTAGDILVFLPGAREIRGVMERIHSRAKGNGFDCYELHGSLNLEEQDHAIRKKPGQKKIVLATNIAETSLTIDGVGTVVDSGLARVLRTDALGFPRLQLSRISLASATQRTGRAGRQGPGHCYRLWSKFDESSLQEFESPEILRADLSESLLTLLAQGVTDPEAFSWFEKPEISSLRFALSTLSHLGFRDTKTSGLTNEGKEALKLPLPPRPARLLLESIKLKRMTLGSKLAALLTEKDIVARGIDLKRQATVESDVLLRLHLLEGRERRGDTDRFAVANVLRITQALEASARRVDLNQLAKPVESLRDLSDDELAMRLLLLGFPDRVAKRRRPKELAARMVGGKGVQLAPFSAVETAELFVALDSYEPPARGASSARSDAQISIASRIELAWLKQLFPESVAAGDAIVFDTETESVQRQSALFYRDLPVESARISRPSSDEAYPALLAECQSRWLTRIASTDQLAPLLTRLQFLMRELPDEESLRFDATEVQRLVLEEVCYGETKLGEVLEKDLAESYLRNLPDRVRSLLRDEAPEALTVPSGSRIRIHYPEGRAPYIEVRIQEVFGWKASPQLARGRVSVQLHLLGPNFRPVQVTSDLESFWRTGYAEVRKELRARYPKHSWPEDPATAQAEAKGRRRQT